MANVVQLKGTQKPLVHRPNIITGRPMPLFSIEEERRVREKIEQYRKTGECGDARRMVTESVDSYKFVTADGHDLFALYRDRFGETWFTHETYGYVSGSKDVVGRSVDAAMRLMG